MRRVAELYRLLVGRQSPVRCVECQSTDMRARRFVAGPDIYICDRCAGNAAGRVAVAPPENPLVTCDFCGATARGVALGSARDAAICADCIALVGEILAERQREM